MILQWPIVQDLSGDEEEKRHSTIKLGDEGEKANCQFVSIRGKAKTGEWLTKPPHKPSHEKGNGWRNSIKKKRARQTRQTGKRTILGKKAGRKDRLTAALARRTRHQDTPSEHYHYPDDVVDIVVGSFCSIAWELNWGRRYQSQSPFSRPVFSL